MESRAQGAERKEEASITSHFPAGFIHPITPLRIHQRRSGVGRKARVHFERLPAAARGSPRSEQRWNVPEVKLQITGFRSRVQDEFTVWMQRKSSDVQ